MLILTLILSACGGGEKATAIPTDTQPPPTPTVPPTPSASDHNEQGKAYFDQRDWEQAAVAFQAAVELEPDNALFLGNLGAALGELGQFDQAITVLEKALELEPNDAKAHSNLCFVYQLQGQLELALSECETALALDDEDADTYNVLGTIYVKRGDPDAAIAQLQRAIQLEPEHDWAHNNLGRAYSDLGRLDEALAELREAIRITPDRAISFYNLGLTLARQELYEQAVPEYQKALELDPNLTGVHKDLGVIYLNLGQAEQAIASFETYLQLEPNDPESAAIEAEIARLKEQVAIFDDLLSETFSAPEGQLSFRHPPDWQVMPDMGDDFFVVTSDLEALEAEDLSQPFGLVIGEIGWTDDFDSADPLVIHQMWLEGADLLEAVGDLETLENDTLRQVSRDYTMSDASGTLNVTLATIVNGGRVVNVMAGATAAGQADYAAVASAILSTIEVQYADPDTPHGSNEVIVTRVPTMTPVSPMPSPSSGTVSPPTEQTAGANGYFAFDANPEGNYEIFVINADGSGLRQLTSSQSENADPSWSPDGSQVVFVSDRDGPRHLYVVDAGGLNLRRLTDDTVDDQSPHWSPEGDKIALVSLGDNSADIFVINADGSGRTNLSNHPSNNLNPAWSPDGSQIAFISDRDGRNQIYVMNADGSHQTRLTDVEGEAIFPAWSPTGDQIAFTLLTESEIDIYVIRLDGSDLRRVTDDPNYDAMPIWVRTPGEPLLAFISTRSGNAELYTLDPQGSLQQITDVGAGVTVGFADWTAGIEIQPGDLSVESVDFTDPIAVLQAVFVAARNQDFAILPYLCDPLHMNDVVTTELCSITADHESKDSFVQYYGAGRIAGEVEYIEVNQKNFARINFIYGPSGNLGLATMELIQRDGLWYLLDQTGG